MIMVLNPARQYIKPDGFEFSRVLKLSASPRQFLRGTSEWIEMLAFILLRVLYFFPLNIVSDDLALN